MDDAARILLYGLLAAASLTTALATFVLTTNAQRIVDVSPAFGLLFIGGSLIQLL